MNNTIHKIFTLFLLYDGKHLRLYLRLWNKVPRKINKQIYPEPHDFDKMFSRRLEERIIKSVGQ